MSPPLLSIESEFTRAFDQSLVVISSRWRHGTDRAWGRSVAGSCHASAAGRSVVVLIVAWEVVEVAISVVGQWLYHSGCNRVRDFLDLFASFSFPQGD